ncbi:hypothetical protein H1R20_g6979, partial [Candolleomyces eurysporus]
MVPPSFINHFLWAPEQPTTAGENPIAMGPSEDSEGTPPVFRFTGSVQSKLSSLVALAFSKAEKPRSASVSVSDVPSERCLVLSCPTIEGTHIIDAAVRHVANKQGADVLVLDALELAAGKLGSIGKEGKVLDEIYAPALAGPPSLPSDIKGTLARSSLTNPESKIVQEAKSENAKAPLSERSRAFINALRRLPTPSTECPDQDSQLPARRIIYFRDFQYILDVAKPLIALILESLHESRLEASFRPATILVFGSTNDSGFLKINNIPPFTRENWLFLNSLFTHARTRLAIRPTVKVNGPFSTNSGPGPPLPPPSVPLHPMPIGPAPSLPITLRPVPFNAGWGKKVDELAIEKLSISVFAANVKSGVSDEEWQKASRAKKIRRVNQLLLKACLEREGYLIEDDWGEGSFDSVLEGQSNTLLEVDHANSIVTIMMGLVTDACAVPTSLADSESSDNPSSPPKLVDFVSQAYKIFKREKRERSEWEKGNDPTEKQGDDSLESNGFSNNGKKEGTEKKPPKNTYDDVKGTARNFLSCIIDTDEISTTFTDVLVDDAIIDSLKTIVTLPLLYPQYFSSGVLGKEAIGGILLYGPPGTGKTMLCRALAKSSRAKMLHIRPSDINHKFVGESEKSVTAVFELAHKLAPCIIFIDEVDSLFSSRKSDTRTWERNVLTEFMQGMDGLRSAKKGNVIVVGATNRPFDLDLAILRRMPRRILVDMPNLPTRKAILESYLKAETLHEDIDLGKIAAQTDGFSGSDLKNLCVAAALSSVKEAIGSDWRNFDSKPAAETTTSTNASFSTNDSSAQGEKSHATSNETRSGGANEEKANGKDKNYQDGQPSSELPLYTITPANIAQARNEISRSTSGNTWGDELYQWHEKYSTDGNTTRATGRNINGIMSNSGLGAGMNSYWNRWAKGGNWTSGHWNRWAQDGVGTNGHWNRWAKDGAGTNSYWNGWAKDGANGDEPTVTTAPAPGANEK